MKAETAREVDGLKDRVRALSDTNERLRADCAKATADLAAAQEFSKTLLSRSAHMEEAHKKEVEDWGRDRARMSGECARAGRAVHEGGRIIAGASH